MATNALAFFAEASITTKKVYIKSVPAGLRVKRGFLVDNFFILF